MGNRSQRPARAPEHVVQRLRDAVARQQRARDELAASRADEAAVLGQLRILGHSWRDIAAPLATLPERSRLAARLRRRAWRLGVVSPRDVNRRPGDGAARAHGALSRSEANHMEPKERLVHRRIVEETFESPDADLELGECPPAPLHDGDELEDSTEPPPPAPKR